MSAYQPDQETLYRYADILINFALGSGEGVKPGESVRVSLPEAAKPFYVPLRNTILKAGANPIMHYSADGVQEADIFELANDDQLAFFPDQYLKGVVDQFDHSVSIIAVADKYELQGVDPKKMFRRSAAFKPYYEWSHAKEAKGQFTWTVAMYGTPAMAADVNMSEEEYWEQIKLACYLDDPNPIQKWKDLSHELERIRLALNALEIESLHVEGENVNLTVGLGKNRGWMGGSGRNIPSFELFISPDWRKTEGHIRFNQPLYRYGNRIDNIALRFENGHVVEASADTNESILKEMIAVENADKIGEYSLTDARFSRITKVMGETLFDENMGGAQGNTHVALGNAYQDSFPGDPSVIGDEEWAEWGYNRSVIHTDIVSTERRTVTATLPDGSTKVIYKDGEFQV